MPGDGPVEGLPRQLRGRELGCLVAFVGHSALRERDKETINSFFGGESWKSKKQKIKRRSAFFFSFIFFLSFTFFGRDDGLFPRRPRSRPPTRWGTQSRSARRSCWGAAEGDGVRLLGQGPVAVTSGTPSRSRPGQARAGGQGCEVSFFFRARGAPAPRARRLAAIE